MQKLDQGSDDEPTHSPRKKSSTRIPLCSMDTLCDWYKQAILEDHTSPADFPPIMIVIEDFESFNSLILQDLVTSLR